MFGKVACSQAYLDLPVRVDGPPATFLEEPPHSGFAEKLQPDRVRADRLPSVLVPQLDPLGEAGGLDHLGVDEVLRVRRAHPPLLGDLAQRRIEAVKVVHVGAKVAADGRDVAARLATGETELKKKNIG